MKERIEYFDFLRGIAIIFVIGIHASGGYFTYVGVQGRPGFDYNILLSQLFRFAVPLFLAVSGYFMAKKHFSNFQEYNSFELKQLSRVYLPCLVWSLPYLALTLVKGSHNQSLYRYLVLYFACGFSVYYFVALIMQFYILLPVFKKLATRRGVAASFVLTAISICFLFYLNYCLDIKLPLIVYAGPIPMWCVFFVIGLYFGNRAIEQSSNRAIEQSSNRAIEQSSNLDFALAFWHISHFRIY